MSYRDACSCALIDAAVCSFGRHTCSFGPFDLQAPIRQRPDRLLEALRHFRCPHEPNGRARLPNPCGRPSNRTSRRHTGTAQCATGARQDRLSVSHLVSRLNTAAGKAAVRDGADRGLGAVGRRSRTVGSLDLLLRACVSTLPRAHSRARLAHTWFDLILKERYLQRAIPMPGRRSCTYCRSGTPPRLAASRAAAVAAIRRSNLPWKRATLLCSTYG